MRVASVLLLAAVLAIAAAAPSEDLITNLPHFNGTLSLKMYSGYLKVSGEKNLHYWFVESQGSPEKDPVALWLNGGPGCSSLDGLLSEHGPVIAEGTGTLKVNPFSWNKLANMLYLEAPAGVGYSYSDNTTEYNTNDDITSMDNYMALQAFFDKFPEYRQNQFFVTGESYGGVYVPTLSQRIIEGNEAGKPKINFEAFAVGNGLSSYELNDNSLVYFAFYHGLIGVEQWASLQEHCCVSGKCNFFNPASGSQCNTDVQAALGVVYNAGLNMYSLYGKCFHNSEAVRTSYAFSSVFRGMRANNGVKGDVPCVDSTASTLWLNKPEVREALHIPAQVPAWTICNDYINQNYGRIVQDVAPVYKKVLGKVRALVYNGDTDMACNFLGDEEMVASLGRDVTSDHRPWYLDNQVGGFTKSYDDITFITVRGAGHMVPQDRPAQAFYMFKTFLENGKY
mmetsp:Transcript_19304/g.49509  ORF Transcript_19304/g.49509 Transcript_19304/m.49509 type:complete len:452 (-) Transcript_19304:767-2122(-)